MEEDSWLWHMYDTVKGSDWLGDQVNKHYYYIYYLNGSCHKLIRSQTILMKCYQLVNPLNFNIYLKKRKKIKNHFNLN